MWFFIIKGKKARWNMQNVKKRRTTETNLLFHFKGILFNMNEYLFINMFIKLHYYLLFNVFHHLAAPV